MTTAKHLGMLVMAASMAVSATAARAETLSFTADLLAVAGTDSKATGKGSAD